MRFSHTFHIEITSTPLISHFPSLLSQWIFTRDPRTEWVSQLGSRQNMLRPDSYFYSQLFSSIFRRVVNNTQMMPISAHLAKTKKSPRQKEVLIFRGYYLLPSTFLRRNFKRLLHDVLQHIICRDTSFFGTLQLVNRNKVRKTSKNPTRPSLVQSRGLVHGRVPLWFGGTFPLVDRLLHF